MTNSLIELLSNIPHELAAFLLSMIPVTELRLALPIAITQYEISPLWALFICSIGNLVPVPFIVLFIRRIFKWLKGFSFFKGIIEKLEKRGAEKSKTVLKYKALGLFILVAVPLPGTGAWTGALVAALMDLRLKKAFPAIALGVLAAGVIVTLMTTGVLAFLGF